MSITDALGLGWVRVVAGLAVVLAIAGAGATVDHWYMRSQVAEAQLETVKMSEAHGRAVAQGYLRGRRAETAVSATITKEVSDAKADAANLARRLAGLQSERPRLLDAITQLAARAAVDQPAGPADGSAPAAGPGLVLSELRRGVDETLGDAQQLALALDASRAAGLRCERIYDSAQVELRKP